MKTIFILTVILSTMNNINAQPDNKDLYISKTVNGSFEEVLQKIEKNLELAGFGIVTDLSMDEKLKEKLNVSIGTYKILGICSPKLAYEAIQAEENIGVFLPCKLIIRKTATNVYEVATFNPSLMMGILNNPELDIIAEQVTEKLNTIIHNL